MIRRGRPTFHVKHWFRRPPPVRWVVFTPRPLFHVKQFLSNSGKIHR
jgi:hypothetical protein